MNQVNLLGKEILGYRVTEVLGSGAFGTVYKVVKQNASGSYIRALKHITLPSEKQYESILNSMGGDHSKANSYFEGSFNEILHEINILNELSNDDGATHIVRYFENHIDIQDNPRSYNVYILMEYLTPLNEHIKANSFTVKDVVDLGLDVLEGLEACHRNKVIHRDIKDDNIFYSQRGGYKIGDFGVAKALKNSERAESVKGTPNYSAPEIILNQGSYNKSVDLYSLGIVLYRLLNYNRNPFLPHYPDVYTSQDEEAAYAKRLTGAIPEGPALGGEALAKVIIKAISPVEERYQEAKVFYEDLGKALHNTSPDILAGTILTAEEPAPSEDSEPKEEANATYAETQREDMANVNGNGLASIPMGNLQSPTSEANKNLFTTQSKKKEQYFQPEQERIVDPNQKVEEPAKPSFIERFKEEYLTKTWALRAGGALVALGIASYFLFTGTPKPVVEEYIKAVAAADFGKAYQYLDVKEQPTLNTPAYLKFVEFSRNSQEDNIYKLAQNEIKTVELTEGVEKNGIIPFAATIVVKKDNNEQIHKLEMFAEKKKAGPLGMFTSYKIAGNNIYAVPKINCLTSTEQLIIDKVKLAGEKEKLNLKQPVFYGWHDVEGQGKLYDAFKDRAFFDKQSGLLKLDSKKFKLNSACQEALLAAGKEFTTLFFPATLTDNGYKQCKAMPNEKTLDEMYKSFSEGFKQVGVSSITINDGKLLSSFAGENGNLHCQYQYIGVYEANGQSAKACDGTINFEYVYDNGQLIVARVNDYTIHLKD